jgi:cell shape-determining protein MreC
MVDKDGKTLKPGDLVIHESGLFALVLGSYDRCATVIVLVDWPAGRGRYIGRIEDFRVQRYIKRSNDD